MSDKKLASVRQGSDPVRRIEHGYATRNTCATMSVFVHWLNGKEVLYGYVLCRAICPYS